jgi:hypothetical protein
MAACASLAEFNERINAVGVVYETDEEVGVLEYTPMKEPSGPDLAAGLRRPNRTKDVLEQRGR